MASLNSVSVLVARELGATRLKARVPIHGLLFVLVVVLVLVLDFAGFEDEDDDENEEEALLQHFSNRHFERPWTHSGAVRIIFAKKGKSLTIAGESSASKPVTFCATK